MFNKTKKNIMLYYWDGTNSYVVSLPYEANETVKLNEDII